MAPRAPTVRYQPRMSVTVHGKSGVVQTSVGEGEWIVIMDDGRRLVVSEKQMSPTGDKSGVIVPRRVLK